MRKTILRVLILICGLNVFTACYGMPPGDWPEPTPLSDEQEESKTAEQSEQTPDPEQSTTEQTALEESDGSDVIGNRSL